MAIRITLSIRFYIRLNDNLLNYDNNLVQNCVLVVG